jgi:hypothetical protein
MAITINLRGHGRRWELDLSTLPAERVQTGSRGLGVFIVIFALFWGGAPVLGLLSELQAGRFGAETLLFLIFPVIGVGLLLFGIHSLIWRRRIAFDGSAFTVAENGLRGTRQWREPLSAYQGVMRHSRRVRTRNSSYTLYMIDLVHPDSDRRINLYTDTSDSRLREKWEAFARRLGLPALEKGEGGMVRREAGDLDKSVGELIDEGKVEIDYDTLSRPAKGLAVAFEGDIVVLTRTGPANAWWGSLIAVLFPLIFIGVAVYAPDMPVFMRYLFGGLGALFEVLFVIGVLVDLLSRQRLRVGPDCVRVNRAYSASESKGKRIDAGDIETVTVARKSSGSRPSLAVASDRESLNFGGGLPGASLEFAMNTVLAKIAETRRRRRVHSPT